MSSHVGSFTAVTGELRITHITGKRFFPCVGPLMFMQIRKASKASLAFRALVRFLACVAEHMLLETLILSKSFITNCTHIELLLCVEDKVLPHV